MFPPHLPLSERLHLIPIDQSRHKLVDSNSAIMVGIHLTHKLCHIGGEGISHGYSEQNDSSRLSRSNPGSHLLDLTVAKLVALSAKALAQLLHADGTAVISI